MSTFVQMQDKIEDDLNRTDLNTQVQREINRAIRKYSQRKMWFNRTTGTFSTVADQQTYGTGDGLPSDIKHITYMRLTYGSTTYYRIRPTLIDNIILWNTNDNSSLPLWYSWFEEKIYLYPTPDAVYTVTLYYEKYYTDLSADGDTNDWTTNPEAEQLIEAEAKYQIYKDIILDSEQASICKVSAQEALTILEKNNLNYMNPTGNVKATQF